MNKVRGRVVTIPLRYLLASHPEQLSPVLEVFIERFQGG